MGIPEKQGKQDENDQSKNTIQYALDTTTSQQKKANASKTWSLLQTTGVCESTKTSTTVTFIYSLHQFNKEKA